MLERQLLKCHVIFTLFSAVIYYKYRTEILPYCHLPYSMELPINRYTYVTQPHTLTASRYGISQKKILGLKVE